jgi:hypothetical protein
LGGGSNSKHEQSRDGKKNTSLNLGKEKGARDTEENSNKKEKGK